MAMLLALSGHGRVPSGEAEELVIAVGVVEEAPGALAVHGNSDRRSGGGRRTCVRASPAVAAGMVVSWVSAVCVAVRGGVYMRREGAARGGSRNWDVTVGPNAAGRGRTYARVLPDVLAVGREGEKTASFSPEKPQF